jgi:RNA polymerase sigma factor (sigma-70 family)
MLLPERLKKLSDSDLIAEFNKTENQLYFAAIYQRYSYLVFGLSMKYLKNEEESQDMVIQVFTKLLTDLKKHEIGYFRGWLFTYTKNFCLMHLRSEKSKEKKFQEYSNNVKSVMENNEDLHQRDKLKEVQLETLETAIDELTMEQKKCVKLFYLQEKSYVEIAEETGYSLNNVKSYIQNGKRNLKIKLEKKGIKSALFLVMALYYFL